MEEDQTTSVLARDELTKSQLVFQYAAQTGAVRARGVKNILEDIVKIPIKALGVINRVPFASFIIPLGACIAVILNKGAFSGPLAYELTGRTLGIISTLYMMRDFRSLFGKKNREHAIDRFKDSWHEFIDNFKNLSDDIAAGQDRKEEIARINGEYEELLAALNKDNKAVYGEDNYLEETKKRYRGLARIVLAKIQTKTIHMYRGEDYSTLMEDEKEDLNSLLSELYVRISEYIDSIMVSGIAEEQLYITRFLNEILQTAPEALVQELNRLSYERIHNHITLPNDFFASSAPSEETAIVKKS